MITDLKVFNNIPANQMPSHNEKIIPYDQVVVIARM
jgi:hypothetical protein